MPAKVPSPAAIRAAARIFELLGVPLGPDGPGHFRAAAIIDEERERPDPVGTGGRRFPACDCTIAVCPKER